MKRAASVLGLVAVAAVGALVFLQPFGLELRLREQNAGARVSGKFWSESSKNPTPQGTVSFADLAEQLSPAVVSVRVERTAAAGVPELPFEGFEEFFGPQPRSPRQRRMPMPRESGAGSGFVISEEGYVLTNNHVVEGADKIVVVFEDGTELEAKLVGRDPKTDLALVKIEGKKFAVAPLGDSDAARVGEWVMAIGNPLGLDHTVTVGILSAKGRRNISPSDARYDDFLQTDASINPGNSGGPLIDTEGRVIGINTAMVNPFRGQNIGFAIPINIAKELLPQLKEKGRVTRGWLGVQIQRVTPALAKNFGLDEPRGALVGDVMPDSPAARSELRRGDIILEFDGKKVDEFDDLPRVVAATPPGAEVDVAVWRDGKKKKLEVKLEQMPDEEAGVEPAPEESGSSDWGFSAEPLSADQAQRMKLEKGAKAMVITQIESGSPADRERLAPGDVILEVNRTPVGNARELEKALAKDSEHALLLIQRGEGTLWVSLQKKE
jgi:serine protease Do